MTDVARVASSSRGISNMSSRFQTQTSWQCLNVSCCRHNRLAPDLGCEPATISLNSSTVDDCAILMGNCFNMPVACTLDSVAVELSEAVSKLINVAGSWGPPPFMAAMRLAVASAAPPARPTPNMVNSTLRSEGDSRPKAASVNGELSAKYSIVAHYSGSRLSFTLAGGALLRCASSAIFSLTVDIVAFNKECPTGNRALKVMAIAVPRLLNANYLFRSQVFENLMTRRQDFDHLLMNFVNIAIQQLTMVDVL